ncbi:MAG: ATP-dependent 6-phosphofructokinase [Patulibacter minatonensis]
MKVGILTAGGDCPGLNAVIRGAARKLLDEGHEPVGLLRGYQGLADPELRIALDRRRLAGILQLGGTILQSSSFHPIKEPEGMARVHAAQRTHPLDAVIAIGGEHTQWISRCMHDEGVPVVGVPKTIDNDVVGTDRTFGVDTAVQVATDAIDRLRTTAQSHDRVMVVEVMGRNSGWIATLSGMAGGADDIVVPEVPRDVAGIAAGIQRRHDRGKRFSIVVISEGAKLSFRGEEAGKVLATDATDGYGYERLGGIGAALAPALEAITGFETRVAVLGHLQRGGSPVATDRVLGTRYGIQAAELVLSGRTGRMVSLQGQVIDSVPLSDTEGVKTVDLALLDQAAVFFS